ncbi:hypothetical protein [Actinoplanes subglobosus]|uniref:Uncharacterized protein n=1 Tax=Actinoplanes subglobosus TaxID=1547892 RepID=A0ABV8IZY7_9ACTN
MRPCSFTETGTSEPLHDFERLALRNYPFLVTVVIVLVVAGTLPHLQHSVRWDWQWGTGFALLLLAYPLSLLVAMRATPVVRALAGNGVAVLPDQLDPSLARLHRIAAGYARYGGWSVAALIAVAWAVVIAQWQADGSRMFTGNVAAAFLETAGGLLAGRFIGRVLFFSGLPLRLRGLGVRWEPQRGHPDGFAGFRPFLGLLAHCLSLVLLIAAYLSAWMLLITFAPRFSRHAAWYTPYMFFLALMIIVGLAVMIHGTWALWRALRPPVPDESR